MYAISGGTPGTGVAYVHGIVCHSCHESPGWGDGHGSDQAAAWAREKADDLQHPSTKCQSCGSMNAVLVAHLPSDQQAQVSLAGDERWLCLV